MQIGIANEHLQMLQPIKKLDFVAIDISECCYGGVSKVKDLVKKKEVNIEGGLIALTEKNIFNAHNNQIKVFDHELAS